MPLLDPEEYEIITFRDSFSTYTVLHEEIVRQFTPYVDGTDRRERREASLIQIAVFDKNGNCYGGDAFRWWEVTGGVLTRFLQDLNKQPTSVQMSLTCLRRQSNEDGPWMEDDLISLRRSSRGREPWGKPQEYPTRFNRKEIV